MPITVAAFVIGGLAILISMNLADLKDQAATFDLNKLEQMESASVILDRNDKIFGQIYVENRETVPYEQLPRDLINAVVSVEDAKFYRHHGYALSGIVRATFKNLVGEKRTAENCSRFLSRAGSRKISASKRSWSFTSTGFTSAAVCMARRRPRAVISANLCANCR